MPDEPNRKIDEALKGYAKKRRADAGAPLELHPATRRLLQTEVARLRPGRAAESSSWFHSLTRFWPIVGFSVSILAALGLVISLINQPAHRTDQFAKAGAKSEGYRYAPEADQAAQNAPASTPSPKDAAMLSREFKAAPSRGNEPGAGPQKMPAEAGPTPALAANGRADTDRENEEKSALALKQKIEVARRSEPQPETKKLDFAAAPAARTVVEKPAGVALADKSETLALSPATLRPSSQPAPVTPAPPTISLGKARPSLVSAGAGPRTDEAINARVPSRTATPGLTGAGGIGGGGSVTGEPAASVKPAGLVVPPRGPGSGLQAGSEKLVARATAQGARREVEQTAETAAQLPRQQFMQVADDKNSRNAGRAGGGQRVLALFSLEQNGNRIRILDADGSIYEGQLGVLNADARRKDAEARLTRAGKVASASLDALKRQTDEKEKIVTDSQPTNGQAFFFQASGTNRSLNQLIVINGNLISAAAPGPVDIVDQTPALRPRLSPESQNSPGGVAGFSRLTANALIGVTNQLEIDAQRVGP